MSMRKYTVDELKNINFSTLKLEDKIAIKNAGRPTPVLIINKETKCKDKIIRRTFNRDIYDRSYWICGCDVTNKLYCFPCILFNRSNEMNWYKHGVDDLGHLAGKIKVHEQPQAHINAQLSFRLLGKQDIRQQLSNTYRLNIEKHNEQVNQNRYILNKIVNCIKFCGAFELALRGHDEKPDSLNPGVFRGLIDFSSELDDVLKTHLEKATVFKGTSKTIQNDILDCILTVCQNQIKNEINEAEFISIIADEATDVSVSFQMSIVFRYVLIDGSPVERFWSFNNPTGHDAQSLFECIKSALQEVIPNKQKLITQSYDGANVMSGKIKGVQSLIKSEYPNAYYVHCYAHQLNLIMKLATSKNKETRIFFSNLTDITNFFSRSTQRISILDEIVNKRLPRTVETRWNFKSRVVNTVYENRESLIECMKKIEVTSNQTIAINQASALRRMLKEPTFIYWLKVFERLMPHIDILYNQLQKRNTDPVEISNAIKNFEINIKKERENIHNIRVDDNHTSGKRKKENFYLTRTIIGKEICDIIIVNINDLFEYKKHLIASNLFLSSNFDNYEKSFPQNDIVQTTKAYPFLNQKKLITELTVIYKRNDFKNLSGAVNLLKFIIANQLQDIFSETSKLLKIVITIPMTTAEAERSFSTMKRIKTFLRNTMSEDRLSSLSMLSIEKELINNISNFNDKVIDVFSKKKERRVELIYKNITD